MMEDTTNLEERVNQSPVAHCEFNGKLHYRVDFTKDDFAKSSNKGYKAYCVVEDERCPYHAKRRNTDYCNR